MVEKNLLIRLLAEGLGSGTIENLPPEEKRKVVGLIAYILSEKTVINLEDSIENAKKVSGALVQSIEDVYLLGNFGFAGGGVMIMGSSVLNLCKAKNNVAKICYGISGVCGGTAAIFGTYAGITSSCGISKVAAGGDFFGGSFLWVGNKAQELGNFVEAKNSSKPRNFVLRKPSTSKMRLGYKGIGFVLPRHVEVKFQTIIIVGGIIITIVSYAKIMIAIYRSLKKRLKPKIQIYTIARFLIDAFNQSESIKKRNRIYYYALRF